MSRGEVLTVSGVVACVGVAIAMVPTYDTDVVNRSTVAWETVQQDPDEAMTLRWLGIPSFIGAAPENWITQELEGRFNLDLQPIILDWNANDKRKPLMFAAGDIPDVIWEGDPLQVRRNVEQGFVIEVPYEVILEHAPTYVRQLNQFGREAWLYADYEQRNYGLPTFAAAATRPRPGVWRRDWLEAVGIDKTPETVEEMHEALYRFRHNDPDGNGRQDTYGTTPQAQHWSLLFADVFAAHGLLPFDFIDRDGSLVWGGIQPEAKDVLAMLTKWNDEGLFDPDFPLAPPQTDQTLLDGNVGYSYDAASYELLDTGRPDSLASTLAKLHPGAELVASKPLRVAGGEPTGRSWGGAAHVIQFGRPLADQPEKVIRVLQMFKAFAKDAAVYLATRTGEEGKHWAFTAEHGIRLLAPYDQREAALEQMFQPRGIDSGIGFYSASTSTPEHYDAWLPAAQRRFDLQYRRPEWSLSNPLGKTDVVPSAGRYVRDLRNYQMKIYMEIVTGARPLEAYDDFVAYWISHGGEAITQEANQMRETLGRIGQIVDPRGPGAPSQSGGERQ